jgi:hypothetical protein
VGERIGIDVSEFIDLYVQLSQWDIDRALNGAESQAADAIPLPQRQPASLTVCTRPHAVPNFGVVLREAWVEHYIGAWLVSTLDGSGVAVDQQVLVTANSTRRQLQTCIRITPDRRLAEADRLEERLICTNEILTDETARRRFDVLAGAVQRLITGHNWPPAY